MVKRAAVVGAMWSFLLFLFLAAPLSVDALTASKCASPTATQGVLTTVNRIRRAHGSPALAWSATLASKAQEHANKCRWEHSLDLQASRVGENIFYTYGWQYPVDGYDPCGFADVVWASQVASYDYGSPFTSRDGGQTVHFTQLVWANTRQVGCGYARCPTLTNSNTPAGTVSDFVVCQYLEPGNWWAGENGDVEYKVNVLRTECQNKTRDDWCSACSVGGSGATCTACYDRSINSGAQGAPIRLDPTTKRCVSACPASVKGCKTGCKADGKCADATVPAPTGASAGRSCPTAPTAASGVLTVINRLRQRHGAPPLRWNDTMAARAVAQAGKCTFTKSPQTSRGTDSELIFRTARLTYPQNGVDACGFAARDWYGQGTSYNWASPPNSLDAGKITDFSQLVWKRTTQVGCGYASCSGNAMVVCQFNPAGNKGGATGFRNNVKKSSCAVSTGDNWCSACSGGPCTACMTRSASSGGVTAPITLTAANRKCTSKCPAGKPNSINCAACTATGSCLRCVAGWSKDATGRCARNCRALFGTGCNSCSGAACRLCASGYTLNTARTACTRSQRRRLRLLGRWEVA